MPAVMKIPDPDPDEQRRLWAQAIADLHNVCELISEHAEHLIPGEHIADFRASWDKLRGSCKTLAEALSPQGIEYDDPSELKEVQTDSSKEPSTTDENSGHDGPNITYQHLEDAALDGANGALKRSVLARWRDAFLGWFLSEPRNEEKLHQAADSAVRYSDISATVLSSLGAAVASVPGVGPACEALEEGVSTMKHLLETRRSRGH